MEHNNTMGALGSGSLAPTRPVAQPPKADINAETPHLKTTIGLSNSILTSTHTA